MESRTEQKLSKHFLNAGSRNAWAIVFNFELKDVFLVVQFGNLDDDIGQNSRFLTSVECVVNRLLYCCNEGSIECIKPKEMFVLFKKFRNCDLLLVRCHLFCNAQFDTSTSGPPPSKTSGQQVTAVDWRGYLMFRQNFLVNTGNLETRFECKKEQENESDNHEQIEPTYDNAHPPNNNCSGCHS